MRRFLILIAVICFGVGIVGCKGEADVDDDGVKVDIDKK